MGITVVVAALATWEIVEIWHHSSIMAPWRARAELRENFISDLLRCPFCMSPYVALACLVGLAFPELPGWLGWLGCIPALLVYMFAVARLANLGNDWGHAFCRTVRYDKLLPVSPGADVEEAEQELPSKPVLGERNDDGTESDPQLPRGDSIGYRDLAGASGQDPRTDV